jgi:hypothetical protein
VNRSAALFERHFRDWIRTACVDWSFPPPPESYYTKVFSRLPPGLRSLLGQGLNDGLIVPRGPKFTLLGIPEAKGPYAWFSRYSEQKRPNPNWEYFVQVGEFIRLHRVARASSLTLRFEDHLMDLALYQGDRLLVCVEVKERARQVQELVRRIRDYESGIDLNAPDRGNDPLRKAKYIARRRPAYFCALAIGERLEYRVEYPAKHGFRFERDVVPWT